MVENGQVTRRKLFTLAGKITRYANHWLYMKICLSFDVIPKGLKLKKNPQIGEKSTEFLLEWNRIMSNAERNLLETLANEYYIVTSTLQIDFWHRVTEFLLTGPNVIEAKQIFHELCKQVEKDLRNIKARREKKLSKLIQDKTLSNVTDGFLAHITFFEDINIVSGIVLHILQVSVSVVLWMCFFIYLVVTACSCIATIVASVPPFNPVPFIHSKVAFLSM